MLAHRIFFDILGISIEHFGDPVNIKEYTGEEIQALRRITKLNQTTFWQNFQVTQSCGCRYEAGRDIPGPVQLLLNIAFGTNATSAATVDALKALRTLRTPSKSPKKAKNLPKIELGFGMLP